MKPTLVCRLRSLYFDLRIWVFQLRYGKTFLATLLALRGSGKHIWKGEHADDYVRRLREDWD